MPSIWSAFYGIWYTEYGCPRWTDDFYRHFSVSDAVGGEQIVPHVFGEDLIVRTRLLPPTLPRRWLRRSRIDDLLAEVAEHAVTVVYASAGYGKSSTLAAFAQHGGWPTIWYSAGEGADDPLLFLLHL